MSGMRMRTAVATGVTGLLAATGAAVRSAFGAVFERVLVRVVYGQHLKQILITMGGMVVGE